jgi:hypothetical protein
MRRMGFSPEETMKVNGQAGYSGTPLAKKLGIGAGCRVLAIESPPGYAAWLAPLPEGVQFQPDVDRDTAVVHLFATQRSVLERELVRLRPLIAPAAAVWVSWPKKASKLPTDITEDTIRALALPLGYVDVKVCAVSDVWSGLKLVIRKELRR